MITVTAEKLTGDQQIILRFYAPGVDPVEPNHFDAAVTVDCFGPVGIVKAALEFDHAAEKILAGGIKLKQFGIMLLNYRHKGKWRVLEV